LPEARSRRPVGKHCRNTSPRRSRAFNRGLGISEIDDKLARPDVIDVSKFSGTKIRLRSDRDHRPMSKPKNLKPTKIVAEDESLVETRKISHHRRPIAAVP